MRKAEKFVALLGLIGAVCFIVGLVADSSAIYCLGGGGFIGLAMFAGIFLYCLQALTLKS